MAAEVTMSGVLRDTLGLLRRHRTYAVLAFFPLFAAYLPLEWLGTASRHMPDTWTYWLLFLLLFMVNLAVQAGMFHYYIRAFRNERPGILVRGYLGRYWALLVKTLQALALASVPGVVALTLFSVVPVWVYDGRTDAPGYDLLVGAVGVLGVVIGGGWPLLRVGAGIAGAAVGERVSLAESWRMTRGSALRLFVFMLPPVLIPAAVELWLVPGSPARTYGYFSPQLLASAAVMCLGNGFLYAAYSVWYVRLRERYALTARRVETAARIAPLDVAADALRLMRLRGRVYLGGALILLALGAPSIWLSRSLDPAHPFTPLTLTVLAVSLLGGSAVYAAVLHDSLSALRGSPGLVPGQCLGRYLRFLGKGVLLTLMALGVTLLCGFVLLAAVLILWPAPEGGQPPVALILLFAASVLLPMAYCAVRWGMALPATVMGDESSFRLSWRMTRGHSLRMLLFTLPFLVLNEAVQVVNGPASESRTLDPFSPVNLAFLLAGTVVMWFTFAAFVIWYEKLRLRFVEAREAGRSGAEEA